MNETKTAIAVIGAGSWGTALAMVLADNGHEVRLWSHNEEQVKEINEKHTNKKYLPEIVLSELIVGYASLSDTLAGVDTIILAVPTKAIREVIGKIRAVQASSDNDRTCK